MASTSYYADDPYAEDYASEYDSAEESVELQPPPCEPCDDDDDAEGHYAEGYAEDSSRYAAEDEDEVFTEHEYTGRGEYTDRSDPTPRHNNAQLSEESYRTASELFSDRSDPTPRAGEQQPRDGDEDEGDDEDAEQQPKHSDPRSGAAAIYAAPQPDEAAPPPEMAECATCNRKFALDRLPRHAQACKKTSEMQKKRKAYDARAQRWQGDHDAEQFVKTAAKNGVLNKPDPEAQASAREAKRKKWQKQSAQIRRAASVGKDDAPPMPEAEEADDRVPCPHCGRKFAAMPAERHIARCKDIRAKPNPIKRKTEALAAAKETAAKEAPAARGGGKAAAPAKGAPKASKPSSSSSSSAGAPVEAERDVSELEAGAARMAERIAGRVSPVNILPGRESPVPALDFSCLPGSSKPSPRLSGGGFGPPHSLEAVAAQHEPSEASEPPPPPALTHELPEALGPSSGPLPGPLPAEPPPSEMELLHKLGDQKFGRHNTRRPPVAVPKKRPEPRTTAAAEARAAAAAARLEDAASSSSERKGGWNDSPPVKPPPGRKVKKELSELSAEAARAESPAPKPAARRPSRTPSSGYGQARPAAPKRRESVGSTAGSTSGASASGGSARSDGSSAETPTRGAAKPAARRSSGYGQQLARPTGGGSERSSASPSTSNRSSSRNDSPVRGGAQCSPGMRAPTVPKVAGTGSRGPSPNSRNASPTASKKAGAGSPGPTRQPMAARSANIPAEGGGAAVPAAKRPPTAAKPAAAKQAAAEIPFFKPAADVSVAACPSPREAPAAPPAAPATVARAPGGGGTPALVPLSRQSSLEEMAKECQSPTPFHVSARLGLADAFDGGATAAAPSRQSAAGAPGLFDRPSSAASTPHRRASFAAETKENAGVGYQEVKIGAFGWRRNSFISRANSPMLSR